jgi:hypothetical protein
MSRENKLKKETDIKNKGSRVEMEKKVYYNVSYEKTGPFVGKKRECSMLELIEMSRKVDIGIMYAEYYYINTVYN